MHSALCLRGSGEFCVRVDRPVAPRRARQRAAGMASSLGRVAWSVRNTLQQPTRPAGQRLRVLLTFEVIFHPWIINAWIPQYSTY